MEKRIKCWHFLQDDKWLRWGTQEVCKVGKTYTCEGELKLCENGMHGSRKIMDALGYAPGNICCKVEIWGEVKEENDKLVGRNRKILKMINAEKILRKFARLCALDVIDKWDAPEVVIQYLKTGNEKLRDAAWGAARGAAGVAAGDAAWDAAWVAAWEKQEKRLVRMMNEAMK